jgi:hypothetical protein
LKESPLSLKNTFRIYRIVNFIETAVNALGMQAFKITDVKRVHIKLIMRKELRIELTIKHNKHLNHFKAVLSELIQLDIIEVNPAFNKRICPLLLLMQTTPQALKICKGLKGIRNQSL